MKKVILVDSTELNGFCVDPKSN